LLTLHSAKGIGAIHAAGVIHKDINTSNIIYCVKTRALNIIDFGISSQLSKSEVISESFSFICTHLLRFTYSLIQVSPTSVPLESRLEDDLETGMEGTLVYMSPEQTGRMNRVVDYRSDFYSLGNSPFSLLLFRSPTDF
jgi:serine/threonine protein kinase